MHNNVGMVVFVLMIFLVPISLGQFVFAQSNQVSYAVNLKYLNLQVSYPSDVSPGDTPTIHIQASAKSTFTLLSLTAQIYYANESNLQQLASATLATNSYMASGNTFSKDIQVSIPQNAPRTSLIGMFSEKAQFAYYGYYSYYPYSYSGSYYYGNYSYPYYNYPYYYSYPYYYDYYPSYYMYPSYSYTSATDDGIAPLSYIKAQTPEYVSLQSDYQSLQQKLAQSQADNQKLQQQLQTAQNNLSQKDSVIADMNNQLNSAKTTTATFEYTSLALVGLVVLLALLGVYSWRRGRRTAPVKETTTKE